MDKIESLSEVIISVLKELSSARQPLTNVSLCHALSGKKEFFQLISQISPEESTPTAIDARPQRTELQARQPELESRKARDHEQKLLRQIAGLEETNSQIRNFAKRSALTLVVLAADHRSPALSSALESFRSSILNDTDLNLQEERLQSIKDLILKEEPAPPARLPEEVALKPVRAALQETPELSADAESRNNLRLYLLQMQNAFFAILSQFETVAPEEYAKRILSLKKRIKASEDMDMVLALGGDVIALIQAYLSHAGEEREQVTAFVAELTRNLSEMERQMVNSLNDTRDSYRENKKFNDTLQVEMEGIQRSVSVAKTIEESRNFVFSKLNAIKQALENKRRQDELRLQTNNEKVGELQKNLQSMKNEITRVQERTKTLEQEVLLDSLIGISNRRAYEMRLSEEIQRYHRYGQSFSLVLFDVDHFKQVNDRFGHRAGDKCLKEIINRIKPCLRTTDFLARYGGEEFVIIITGTKKEDAYHVAEKIRRIVEKTRFLFQGQEIPVTISLGVTEIEPQDTSPDGLFTRVDAAMYKAKNSGRNRVCTG
jgi:diguanylate cyclase (GGDEF)-like protein